MNVFLFVILSLNCINGFAGDLTFNAVAQKPSVLELAKFRPLTGKLELRYIHDSPHVIVRINSHTKEISDFILKVLDSDLSKLFCDGDFDLTYDSNGTQSINIKSIKVCTDADGFVVAHSVGIPHLTEAQIAVSSRMIKDTMSPTKVDTAISQSTKLKENPNAGVFSMRKSTNPAQTQQK